MTNKSDSGKIIVKIPAQSSIPAQTAVLTEEMFKCLLCPHPISIISTAIYSQRNMAFMHVECRDRAVAKAVKAEKAAAAKREREAFPIFLVVVPKN